jgi:hypothetical protein
MCRSVEGLVAVAGRISIFLLSTLLGLHLDFSPNVQGVIQHLKPIEGDIRLAQKSVGTENIYVYDTNDI